MQLHKDAEDFFIGVIRNEHATSRMDNPELVETNEEYQKARELFLTEKRARLHSDQEVQCEVCTLTLAKGIHVHHIDGDHKNNDPENFSARCPFCHWCEHIGWVGNERKGVIIHAPDISQQDLNQLLVTAYALEYGLNQLADGSNEKVRVEEIVLQLRALVQAFESTQSIVQRNFQTNDPAEFGDKFLAMTEEEYLNRSVGTFSGLRLFFHPDGFQNEIAIWAETIFGFGSNKRFALHPTEWLTRARIFAKQAEEVKI